MQPIHRDDVPMEVMEEFEKYIKEKFPGAKVTCAGDQPGELPPEVQEHMQAIEQLFQDSMLNGTCLDCGAQMPGYNPLEDDWEPHPSWHYFKNTSDNTPMGWQCPACDAEERENNEPGFRAFGNFPRTDDDQEGRGSDQEGSEA